MAFGNVKWIKSFKYIHLLILLLAGILLAGEFSWTGGVNSDWTNSGNWNLDSGVDDGTNGYPDGVDNATINATVTLTNIPSTLNNLTISGGTVVTTGNIDISGSLSISAGTYAPSAGTVQIQGGMAISGTGTFSASGSNLIEIPLGGTTISTTNANGIVFQNLTHNPNIGTQAGASLTISSTSSTAVTVNGDFTKADRSGDLTLTNITLSYGSSARLIYDLSDARDISNEWINPGTVPNVVLQAGAVTLPGAETLVVDTKLTRINGTLTTTGTLQYSAAELEYAPSPAAAVTVGDEWVSGADAPQDVTINNSGNTVTSSTDRTVPRILTLTAGTISCGSNTLTVLGDVVSSDVAGSGSIDTASPTTLSMGDGANSQENQTISGAITLNTLVINKETQADIVTLTGSLTFDGTTPALTVTRGIFDANGRPLSGSHTLSVANGATFQTGGSDLSNSTLSLVDGSIFVFDGSTAESMPSDTYGNVTINNTSTPGVTLGGAITLSTNSTITVASSRRINLNGFGFTHGASDALVVNGTLYTDGSAITGFNSYTFSGGTIRFNGTSGQETAPSTIYLNLVINNADGLAIASGGITVTNSLTFTSGVITSVTGSLLTLAEGASATPTSTSFVTGPVTRQTTGTGTSFSFPLGIGTNLRSVTLNFSADPSGSGETITAEATGTISSPTSSDPDVKSVENDGGWTITTTTTTNNQAYSATFITNGFSPSIDVSSNVTLVKGTSPNFDTEGASISTGTNSVTSSFTDGFSDFAIGNLADVYTWAAGDGNWSLGTNWDVGTAPGNGDVVVIITGVNVSYDASVTTTNYSSVTLQGTGSLSLDATTFNFSGTSFTLNSGTLTFNGATITNYDGANTVFSTGSTVQYNTGVVQTDTYYNLIVNNAAAVSSSGAITVNGNFTKSSAGTYTATAAIDVAGNVTLTAGTVTPTGGMTIAGNITGNGGQFSTSSGTVTLDGTGGQSISGTTDISFNNLTLDNSNGLSLSQSPRIEGTLTLTSGLIATGANELVIGTGGSTSGAGASTYINGRCTKEFAANSSGVSFLYPVGKGGDYRPLTIGNISVNAAGIYSRAVEMFNASALSVDPDIDGTTLSAVSIVRYWEVAANTGAGGLTAAPDVTLTWGTNDNVDGSLTALDVAQLNSGTTQWTSIGGDGSGSSSSGSITSAGIVTPGTFFTLGDDAAGGQDNSLPVELLSFRAVSGYDQVTLNWQTASEIENLGFNVYKKEISENTDQQWSKVNEAIINGQGNSSVQTDYTFVDTDVKAGTGYSYRLESVSYNGIINVEGVIDAQVLLPERITLFNNYPNPFNPTTNIKFQLPEYATVSLAVYDVNGKLVKDLLKNAAYDAGQFVVTWDATDNLQSKVSSGMYIYRFTTGSFSKIGRMLLIK